MLSLLPPGQIDFEPNTSEINVRAPQKHRSLTANPLKEGEIVILKDGSEAKDWYCAQLVKVFVRHQTPRCGHVFDWWKMSDV
jgi:hypothetical protein